MPRTLDRNEYGWAVDLVRAQIEKGLERLCDERFLKNRYRTFQQKQDPIYAGLLNGMQDEALARTFVSYWTIAHTMASQSRFWLEHAVIEILVRQVRVKRRALLEIYSQQMLANDILATRKPVSALGERFLEELLPGRKWEVPVQRAALQRIDSLVGEQERARRTGDRRPFESRDWDAALDSEVADRDRTHLREVVSSLTGPPPQDVALQCNLLVIEPDRFDGRPHAWAIRFVNPKTIANHAARKQERVNMLRLYAYLVQEKILRDPSSLRVCVAALTPRTLDSTVIDPYPDYFSSLTFWSNETLWKFIGVPFEVVTTAVDEAAATFRDRLKSGLRELLPEDADPFLPFPPPRTV